MLREMPTLNMEKLHETLALLPEVSRDATTGTITYLCIVSCAFYLMNSVAQYDCLAQSSADDLRQGF
jgi:hypothetical protein